MRCGIAAIQALSMHPDYRYRDGIMEEATGIAESLFTRGLDCIFLADMPSENARAILEPEINRLIRTQRPTGMWKIKDARRISYWVLKALNHSGLLSPLLEGERLRRDPFLSFREGNDYYGFLVRRNIMEELQPGDESLREKLMADVFSGQDEEGSWKGTVISTSSHMDSLMELGVDPDDSRVRKGSDWLLSVCAEDVRRVGKKFNGAIVGHYMFSVEDWQAEFRSAQEEKPEWNPVGGCYRHLPMIQTGTALKTLIRLGFESDERVVAACDNLLELRQKYGGWCDSNIRTGLLEAQRAEKQARSTRR